MKTLNQWTSMAIQMLAEKIQKDPEENETNYDDHIFDVSWEIAGSLENDEILELAKAEEFLLLDPPMAEWDTCCEGIKDSQLTPGHLMNCNLQIYIREKLIEELPKLVAQAKDNNGKLVCWKCSGPLKLYVSVEGYKVFDVDPDTKCPGNEDFDVTETFESLLVCEKCQIEDSDRTELVDWDMFYEKEIE